MFQLIFYNFNYTLRKEAEGDEMDREKTKERGREWI